MKEGLKRFEYFTSGKWSMYTLEKAEYLHLAQK